MTIEIVHPMYGHRQRDGKLVKAVGLAEWRIVLEDSIVQVKITQEYHARRTKKNPSGKEKDGKPIYPTLYCIPKSEISKYPQKMAGDGKTVLRIVPLEDMSPKHFDLKQPQYYKKPVEKAQENNTEIQPKLL